MIVPTIADATAIHIIVAKLLADVALTKSAPQQYLDSFFDDAKAHAGRIALGGTDPADEGQIRQDISARLDGIRAALRGI